MAAIYIMLNVLLVIALSPANAALIPVVVCAVITNINSIKGPLTDCSSSSSLYPFTILGSGFVAAVMGLINRLTAEINCPV